MLETLSRAVITGPRRRLYLGVALGAALALAGCAAQVDRHGHVFSDVDLQQIQPGMSKDQVRLALGTPDTTAAIGGDIYYYISSTRRTRPMQRPKVIDRKIVAVYFDQSESVRQIANYGLKDGRVFDFIKGKTPSQGKEQSLLAQLFGNLGNRLDARKDKAPY